MPVNPIDHILITADLAEKKSKKRAIAFVFLPVLFAIVLIVYTSNKIIIAQKELLRIEYRMEQATKRVDDAVAKLDSIKKINLTLRKENDSLKNSLVNTTVLTGKQVAVFSDFKKFIDNMKSYDRSFEQAAFWINFRMLEDKIRGNYEYLSKKVATLPELDSTSVWVVIVASSASFEDLKGEAHKLQAIYGKDQVAIYKNNGANYSIAIEGNGTFTRAYRINVDLRDKYGYAGAYFSSSKDWGANYLW